MKSLVVIKHGSYLDVYERVTKDGGEYYHSELFWHKFVEKLSLKYDVTIISVNSSEHNVLLPNRVRSIGVDLYKGLLNRLGCYIKVLFVLSKLNPHYVIVRNPEPVLLYLSLIHSKALLPMFADSFTNVGMMSVIRAKLLRLILSSKKISYISNHNLAACLSLSALGIEREKIVPWDWYYDMDRNYPVKRLVKRDSTVKLIYVGKVTYGKGVGEIIEALKYINDEKIYLTVVGEGKDIEQLKSRVSNYQLERNVSFLGKVENSRIIELMRNHEIVVVPSRKKEAEGLPVTIYEALISRTPLICSNHPMFVSYLKDGISASIFEESNHISLADNIRKLAHSPNTYEMISTNSRETLEAMICPVKIDKVIENWLQADNAWFRDKTMNVLSGKG
jgi:glycosyltransferase involved in cell wall biosynthesis